MKPEEQREELNQHERKTSATGNHRDSLERASHGSLKDLSSGLNTKGLALVIVGLIVIILGIAIL